MQVRLQKYLADAGVASRRASEQIMLAGRVSVNGEIVRQLGSRIDPELDRVAVDGAAVKPKRKLYLAVNKPRGFICSRNDPFNRRSVHDLLPKEWTGVYSVGRLDFDSEGLLFLTNDGDFSLCVAHPRYGIRKKYLATVVGRVGFAVLHRLTRGVSDEGEVLKAEKARLLKSNGSHSQVELELNDGKNREVRRLFEAMGFSVERLQRVQIGPIRLAELPSGRWRTLTPTEVKSLLQSRTESRSPRPEVLQRDAPATERTAGPLVRSTSEASDATDFPGPGLPGRAAAGEVAHSPRAPHRWQRDRSSNRFRSAGAPQAAIQASATLSRGRPQPRIPVRKSFRENLAARARGRSGPPRPAYRRH